MKFKIDKFNYNSLPGLIDVLKKNKTEKIEIELTENIDNLPRFSEIMFFVYNLLDQEIFFQVWLKNFPFCVLNSESIDHIFIDNKYKGEKDKVCKKCFWSNKCSGFPKGYFNKYDSKEVCCLPDVPWEVMIEVEPKCNFKCKFCFNNISFSKENRDIKRFSTNYVKKIIDNIVKANIKIIRFTGGEPLLRKDIFELIKYAKDKGLETRLNTNCSLINSKNIDKFKDIVDNILIPIESNSEKKEAKITGYNFSLKKKVEAINLLKDIGIPKIRIGTVATKDNILNFDKLAKFVFNLPIDEWELYRPILVSKKDNLNSKLIKILVDKIINLRKKINKPVFIANALPFCSIKNLNKINSVSKGALFDDGHTRLAIDPRNFVKPHYFMDENIGDPLNILNAWQNSFMKKMRNLEYLPKECKNCNFIYKCRGGSRQIAKMAFGDYNKLDPLANIKNYAKS
ncbi:radical SAM protein [Patescibacteria group bacterium]|nr:radical SAM protein [Patescibacteria group bacterium]